MIPQRLAKKRLTASIDLLLQFSGAFHGGGLIYASSYTRFADGSNTEYR
jgi:hypothetical protein